MKNYRPDPAFARQITAEIDRLLAECKARGIDPASFTSFRPSVEPTRIGPADVVMVWQSLRGDSRERFFEKFSEAIFAHLRAVREVK